MKKGIIIGLITVALTFIGNYLLSEKSELKYTLSEKITSDFSDKIEEIGIQQLTINNTGDIEPV